jgi:hypothetical protein
MNREQLTDLIMGLDSTVWPKSLRGFSDHVAFAEVPDVVEVILAWEHHPIQTRGLDEADEEPSFCSHGVPLDAPCEQCTVDKYGENDPFSQDADRLARLERRVDELGVILHTVTHLVGKLRDDLTIVAESLQEPL